MKITSFENFYLLTLNLFNSYLSSKLYDSHIKEVKRYSEFIKNKEGSNLEDISTNRDSYNTFDSVKSKLGISKYYDESNCIEYEKLDMIELKKIDDKLEELNFCFICQAFKPNIALSCYVTFFFSILFVKNV